MGVEPTKLTAAISLLLIIASTASLSPLTTLNTPGGRPASKNNSANFITSLYFAVYFIPPPAIITGLIEFKIIFAAAGHPSCVFKITYNELIKITKGEEKDISE